MSGPKEDQKIAQKNKNDQKLPGSRKGMVWGLVGLLASIGLVVAGYTVMVNRGDSSKDDQAVVSEEPELTPTEKSEQAISFGEYDEGQQILLDLIDKAGSKEEKASLYMELATNALNEKKYDQVEGFATSAFENNQAYAIDFNFMIARAKLGAGDKDGALEYAEKAKAAITDETFRPDAVVKEINEFIEGTDNEN